MPLGMRSTSAEISAKDNVNRRLGVYAAAAAAAGVSLLSLAQPADGSVVVTSANVTIGLGTPVSIDMNADGKSDFEFFILQGGYDHSFYKTLAVAPLTGGKVVGGARGPIGPYGSALASGANIGGTAHFSSSVARGQVTIERTNGSVSGSSRYTPYGQWGVSAVYHYLGVRFLINGTTHYGWIKMYVTRGSSGFQGFISEFAYETVAGKTIAAGATAAAAQRQASREEVARIRSRGPSLGMLAAGAEALPVWRRETPAAKPQPITPQAGE